MKVLIELPTWLGDSIMTTPAIENLCNYYGDVEITILGSDVSVEVMKNHPKVIQTYVLTKKSPNLLKILINLGRFDIFISFRSSFRSKVIKFLTSSRNKYQFDKFKYKDSHQVEKYNNFVNDSLNINTNASKLILYPEKKSESKNKKLLGINPGASYGDAKQWYPKRFADVASRLSSEYDIVIFGGPKEKSIAKDIEKDLTDKGIYNFKNLSGKLSVEELVSQIANLDLFITGDSGPMHIAAALQVPSVTIFGPTKEEETSQWMNKKSIIVKKYLECQPCMKRTCPLNHHNCMKRIMPSDIIIAIESL
jgi:heptosyltransferase II